MTSPEKNPSDPLSGTGTTQTHGASQTQSGAEATQGEGEHLTERARRKAGELAGDLKRQAEELAEDMRQRARSAVDQQKEVAIGGIEGVAHALRSASDDLRERGQPLAAEYSRQVADGLESLANWVSRRNVDDVTGGLEDFARQRPVAFIGGAMVAGFALARFMKSSSARRSRTTASTSIAGDGTFDRPRRSPGSRHADAAICISGHGRGELRAAHRGRHLMQHTDDRSLKELFGDLSHSVSNLFRKEIELARAEASEKISQAGVAAGSIAAGGILALAALIVLLQALVIALTELGLAPALSSLIVGGVVAIIAFALIYKGINDLKGSNLAPRRTVESLRQDAHMVKEQAR